TAVTTWMRHPDTPARLSGAGDLDDGRLGAGLRSVEVRQDLFGHVRRAGHCRGLGARLLVPARRGRQLSLEHRPGRVAIAAVQLEAVAAGRGAGATQGTDHDRAEADADLEHWDVPQLDPAGAERGRWPGAELDNEGGSFAAGF